MSPDTQQNIFYLVYHTILHNYEAMFYALGVIIFTLVAVYKPKRAPLLVMWGFIFLLFAFEYKKHIIDALREQTLNALITERESYRIERIIHLTFNRAIPIFVPLTGWILVVMGILGMVHKRVQKWIESDIKLPFKSS